MNLSCRDGHVRVFTPTLEVGVPDEVDEAPLQGLGGGFTASQEQIQTAEDQVPVLKPQLTVSVLSDTNTGSLKHFLFEPWPHYLLPAPYSLLDEEAVDVISWVAGVQIRFMPLNLSPNECLQRCGAAEDAVVRPRQVFHQRWERIIHLFGENRNNRRCSRQPSEYLTYESPYGAFQIRHLRQVVQHALEDVVSVVKAPPKHDLADDVGHGVVQQGHGVKRLP